MTNFNIFYLRIIVRCLPRWSVFRGFTFNPTVDTDIRMSMSEMESNGLLPKDVKARYYMGSMPATLSLEYCARYNSCDQWSLY